MNNSLVWVGDSDPPAALTDFAEQRALEVVCVSPSAGPAAVTTHRPAIIATAALAFEAIVQAAPDAVLVYAPATTEPDAVSTAVAAGADVVLPQDADTWGVTALTDLVDGVSTGDPRNARTVPTSDGGGDSASTVVVGDPPEPLSPEEREPVGERHAEQGILTTDEAGDVSYVGDRAAELLGRDAADLLGQSLTDALPWTDVERLQTAATELLPSDDGVSVAERLMPANRWLELTADPTETGATISVRALDADARREIVLNGLHGVTRRLFGATTKTAVAEIACEASRDVLGLEAVVVRLHEDGKLQPTAVSQAVEELMPDRPTYADDEGMAGAVFESGQPQIRTDEEDGRLGQMRSCMYLPLGSHGTLSIGAVVPDAFDDADVRLANLFATTVTVALDRAEHEQQLRRREAVLESVRGMLFVLDSDRRIDYLTDPLADRLGADREALVGRHVVDFIDITEYYRAESLFDALEEGGDGVSIPMEVTPELGNPFHAEVELSQLDGAEDVVVGIVEDRSQLVATRDNLERERKRLWTLFENLPDPVVETEHIDGVPVVRSVNDAFTDVFGYEPETVVDKPLDDVLVPPADERGAGPEAATINNRVGDGEVTGEKVRRETAEGSRSFLFRGIPYTQGGDTRAFALYTDVTDIERQEHHAKVLDRLLRHNLRNELGLVIGYAENIAARADEETLQSEANALVEAASGLVDLSDTAKRIRRIIESPDSERIAIDIGDLFADVTDTASGRHPGLDVEVNTAERGLVVQADEHLRVALGELVDNVAGHGGSHVTLRAKPVAAVPDSWVDICVVDDGPGIPESERAVISGERSITQLNHGSGLGLWLVRWAVESVGGDLGFERVDGETVVRLRLRRAE